MSSAIGQEFGQNPRNIYNSLSGMGAGRATRYSPILRNESSFLSQLPEVPKLWNGGGVPRDAVTGDLKGRCSPLGEVALIGLPKNILPIMERFIETLKRLKGELDRINAKNPDFSSEDNILMRAFAKNDLASFLYPDPKDRRSCPLEAVQRFGLSKVLREVSTAIEREKIDFFEAKQGALDRVTTCYQIMLAAMNAYLSRKIDDPGVNPDYATARHCSEGIDTLLKNWKIDCDQFVATLCLAHANLDLIKQNLDDIFAGKLEDISITDPWTFIIIFESEESEASLLVIDDFYHLLGSVFTRLDLIITEELRQQRVIEHYLGDLQEFMQSYVLPVYERNKSIANAMEECGSLGENGYDVFLFPFDGEVLSPVEPLPSSLATSSEKKAESVYSQTIQISTSSPEDISSPRFDGSPCTSVGNTDFTPRNTQLFPHRHTVFFTPSTIIDDLANLFSTQRVAVPLFPAALPVESPPLQYCMGSDNPPVSRERSLVDLEGSAVHTQTRTRAQTNHNSRTFWDSELLFVMD